MKQINFYSLRQMLVALMEAKIIECPPSWRWYEYADHLISEYYFKGDFVKNDAIVYHLKEIFDMLGVDYN